VAGNRKKNPNPIDLHVGERIRYRRIMTQETQEGLATKLGLTLQQIHKYEKGENRVSASRLFAIAQNLQVPISYFFEGVTGTEDLPVAFEDPAILANFMKGQEILQLNHAFSQIANPKVRANIIRLASAAAGVDDQEHDASSKV
jgi:transcriptional regulator with XRE-family HTH domain